MSATARWRDGGGREVEEKPKWLVKVELCNKILCYEGIKLVLSGEKKIKIIAGYLTNYLSHINLMSAKDPHVNDLNRFDYI